MAEVSSSSMARRILYTGILSNASLAMADYPLMGVVRVRDKFSEIGEARHFKFRVLIDREEYYCMHDKLPPKWMCSGSCDLLNVGKC